MKERIEEYQVAVFCDDVAGGKMAGPGIRAWEISKCLSKQFKVILAIPDYSDVNEESRFFKDIAFEVVSYSVKNPSLVESIARKSKIIITQGYILSKFPVLLELPVHIVVDMYVPFVLENLFIHKEKTPNLKDREFIHLNDLRVYNEQIIHGDHFLCANDRQKDLFMGSLMSLNRIGPEILDLDPSLNDLITVIPFGISENDEEDNHERDIRSRFSQIRDNDVLLLWGGVISNWFDPVTLLYAMHEALKENQNIKLFFLSTIHPNPLLPEFDMAKKAMQISNELQLTDKHVFFNDSWIDYNKRGRYFRDADIGVSIHESHFETYYSSRTRILDYFKYNLPIICTEGDYFADLVRQENLGITVPSGSPKALKRAILILAEKRDQREQIRERMQEIKERLLWDRVTESFVRYCGNVLSGKIRTKKRVRKKDIAFVAGISKVSFIKKIAKKHLWLLFQKLPLRLAYRLRGIFKFLR